MNEPDVLIVGAGLAGLVAAHELVKAGRRVLIVEQENRNNLGGQAFWSLAGLFFVDSPEQRRLGIKDSYELALQDWMGSAGFDREREDFWPRQWAEAYVRFAAGEKRRYLFDLGLRVTPIVGWAERGDGSAHGHGNSVPRFHLTWGTGPELVRIFAEPVLEGEQRGLVEFAFRHRVDELIVEDGAVVGVRGTRARAVRRARARARVVTRGGRRVRAARSRGGRVLGRDRPQHRSGAQELAGDRLGGPPETIIAGVPAHVDGRMLAITEQAGGNIVNRDRMWHYVEGVHNWDPIWPNHAIRILPGPSSLWFDANGDRLERRSSPVIDTLGTLRRILSTGHDYSWFILTQSIIEKEFALSGSEQNPDVTGKDVKLLLKSRVASRAPGPVEAFKQHGVDFVVRDDLRSLVAGMNELARGPQLDYEHIERQVLARDREVANRYTKDAQVMQIHNMQRYRGGRFFAAKPHRLLDPDARTADRGAAEHPQPQDPGRARDQPRLAGHA